MSLSPAITTPNTSNTLPTRPRIDSTTSSIKAPQSGSSRTNESDAQIAEPVCLVNEISKLLGKNPIGLNNEHLYVPEEELNSLLSLDTISGALGKTTDLDLAQYILLNARKTFATLHLAFEHAETHRIKAMQTFKKTGFTDETLSSKNFVGCEGNCKAVNKTCQHYFPSSVGWSVNSLNYFASKRWQFLVPDFDKSVFRYNFHHQQILPWRGRFHSTVISSGSFSDVTCLSMLARHQNLLPPQKDGTVIVAHKTLKPMDEVPNYDVGQEWIRESIAHENLNERSEHLIRGIGAYQVVNKDTKHNTYHLILEWADGGNLLSFWRTNPEPQLDNNTERSRKRVWDLLKQFRGLTEALECMHFGAASSRRSSVQDLEIMVPQSPPRDSNGPSPMPTFDLKVTSEGSLESRQPIEPMRPGIHKTGSMRLTVPVPEPGKLTRTDSFTDNWRHGDIKPENILRFKSQESTATRRDVSIRKTVGQQHEGNDQHDANSHQDVNSQQWVGNPQCAFGYKNVTEQKKALAPEDETQLGTLKLADLGRARQHQLRTVWRMTTEKERFRTRWYEPPDLSTDLEQVSQGKISRLFDIWSLGCVILDGLIWMLYGADAIDKFQSETPTNSEHLTATPYWIRTDSGAYEITDAALLWMDRILQDGQKRSGAIVGLVRLLKERLLKIDLPLDSEKYTPGYRTHAKDMREQLDHILSIADQDKAYLFSGLIDDNALSLRRSETVASMPTPVQPLSSSSLQPARLRSRDQPRFSASQATRIAQEFVYTDDMTDEWQYPDDHTFAEQWIDRNQLPDEDDGLCTHCRSIDITGQEMTITRSNLEAKRDECLLCDLLNKALKRENLDGYEQVRLVKALDSFIIRQEDGEEKKILRICCVNDTDSKSLGVPLGAPDLCEQGRVAKANDSVMRLPKAWLDDCDNQHGSTCNATHNNAELPKRLIDVRNLKPKIIDSSSFATEPTDIRYIAFSHKWGKMPENAKTTRTNLPSRRAGIPLREIPPSFADAIAITKALGCRYLWIDCLCINQGDDGDFTEQAASMQTVFSKAYCVIAAASAKSAMAGFWRRDVERNPLTSVRKGEVFISAVTNDFARDVLGSPLNQRGWVLQEHALARRTIFFTENQMYWECGDGIRCETLRKLRHDVAGLLGDADFPSQTIQAQSTRGTQIHLWTRLFEQYSSLGFTYPEDRSVAIEGLMARLTNAFRTRSLYGVFESFWGRCLLWRRPHEGPSLTRIAPGKHMKKLPPTWSWMAVTGTIAFLNPKGGEVVWNTSVGLPFAKNTKSARDTKSDYLHPNAQLQRTVNGVTNDSTKSDAIEATAYSLTTAAQFLGDQNFHYDDDAQRAGGQVKAVIICTSKDRKEHHVLLLSTTTQTANVTSYERVGVGRLPDTCIDRSSELRIAIG